jgi:predicted PurR-regulated permease PerM
MKNTTYKQYIIWGVTAFAVVAFSILLYFVLYRAKGLSDALNNLLKILTPFIYGAVLAYLFNPIYTCCEKLFARLLALRFKKTRWTVVVSRSISILITMALTLTAIFGLFYLVIPQLAVSVFGIINRMPQDLANLKNWMDQLMDNTSDVGPLLMNTYNSVVEYIEDWLLVDLRPLLGGWAVRAYTGLLVAFTLLFNLFIGLVVMVYLLISKRTFAAQGKKLIYSIFGARRGNTAIEIIRYTHRVFGGFINGKLIESLMVGMVCFLFMAITNMPYAMLISVIIGVTNVIPFFGPFIGAIPCALLLLFESPTLCLYFLIFILIVQQVDGNIIAPRILRGTTGLPSFWVLFSILFFGRLFGFIGMVVGVPVFALIYSLVKYLINRGLEKQDLPSDTEVYFDMHHIDDESREAVKTSD